MITGDADWRDGISAASPEGRDRKSRAYGAGVSKVTAGRGHSQTEAKGRLMELVVSRDNMLAAHRRVMANKGSAGVDDMPVEALMPHLREHWAAIKEDSLDGRYQPSPVAQGRDTQARRQGNAPSRHSNGSGSADPTGAASGADADIRSGLLGFLLRVPARTERPPGGSRGPSPGGFGSALGGRYGPGEVPTGQASPARGHALTG